jgi:hypothetical protein
VLAKIRTRSASIYNAVGKPAFSHIVEVLYQSDLLAMLGSVSDHALDTAFRSRGGFAVVLHHVAAV